jgi:hypothetical protein
MMNAAMSQGIVGTYAAEMQTAEGAVRGLSQSFKGLVQALGSLFIPILQAAIPYLTAFIQLLTEAIAAVAAFFGISFFEIDWGNGAGGMASEVEGAAAGAEKLESGMGGAAKAAKKIKDYVMGFDELNIIRPKDENSGGGGAGGSGVDWGDGLDLDTLWDESVFAKASDKVDEVKEKLKTALGFVGLIGAGFAAWKIASSFMTALDTVKLALQVIAGQKGAGSAMALFASPEATKKLEKLASFLKKTSIGSLILGSGSTSVGAAALAVAAVMASIAALAGGLVLVYNNSENFRAGLAAIGEAGAWVFEKIGEGFAWAGEKIGEFGGFVKEKLTGIVPEGVLEFFEGLELGIGDLLITAGGLALFGPMGLLIEGAVLAIKGIGHAASDSLPEINLFGEGISQATREKVEPFLEKMDDLENALNTLDWGNAIIGEDDLANISNKLGEVTNIIVNELDADKNKALAKINPLKGALSEEKYEELLEKIEKSYGDQVKSVKDGESRIKKILEKASKEARALTDEEAAEIAKIQLDMKNTGIKYLSESETESNLILKQLKDNATRLSAEQASSVIKSAKSARDETVKAAEDQYKGILLEAQRLLDAGAINDTEYGEIVKAAKTTRDETVAAAESQYNDIVKTAKTKMGEYSKYIDEETGEIKSNWRVFCEDLSKRWSEGWSSIQSWWDNNMAKFFTKKYWQEKFDTIKQGASEKLGEVKGKISEVWEGIRSWFKTNVAPKLTKDYWKEKFSNIAQGIKDKWAEAKNWWDNNKPTLASVQASIAPIKDKLSSAWNTAKDWWNSKPALASVSVYVGSIKDKISSAWNTAQEWLNKQLLKLNIQTPHITVSWNYNISGLQATIANFLFGKKALPKLNVNWYARGGFPGMGEMFVAREAGPELVGRIGSRNAVVNNDQIVEAVSQGVYAAVAAAMGSYSGGSDQAINVYLDGKQITAVVEKRQKERGATLMTGGMAYGY